MKLTIEQVKADIESGKSSTIYYSSKTCWWTHLRSDLEESTKLGDEAFEQAHQIFMYNPNIPELQKKRRQSLYEVLTSARASKHSKIQLDTTGAPLYQTVNAMNWLKQSIEKNGIHEVMLAHHHNSEGISFPNWETVRTLLDVQPEKDMIGVCQNHPEYITPVISTMAFMGAEAWCPFCGATYGMFGIKTVNCSPVLEYKHRWYKRFTHEFLKTRSRAVCSTLIWEGREIRPDQLPKEERIRMQTIIDSFKYGIKVH